MAGEDQARRRDNADPGEARQSPSKMQHDGKVAGDLAVAVHYSWVDAVEEWIMVPLFGCPKQSLSAVSTADRRLAS